MKPRKCAGSGLEHGSGDLSAVLKIAAVLEKADVGAVIDEEVVRAGGSLFGGEGLGHAVLIVAGSDDTFFED